MKRIPLTTLEQWAVLRAVISHGGFAQAAEALNRSQSSVSYAVARLRDGIGIDLMRIDGRKAHLTPAGLTLLNEATPLIDDMLRLERRAQTVANGEEADVTVLVDDLFPRSALLAALNEIQSTFKNTDVHLYTVPRLDPARLAERNCDFAIALWHLDMPPNEWTTSVDLIPVAHPDHPLAATGNLVGEALLARHRCAVITGQEPATMSSPSPPGALRRWHVNDIAGAVDMVESGLCWGWLPEHRVTDAIVQGRLVPLNLAAGSRRAMRLCLVLSDRVTVGPVTRTLCNLLQQHADYQLRRSV